jgi:subtilisin
MTYSNPFIREPETTGKYLVLFRDRQIGDGIQRLSDFAGVTNVARAVDFQSGAPSAEESQNTDTLVLDNLGVAVVRLDPDQFQSLRAVSATVSPILTLEPERVVYALDHVGSDGFAPKATWGLEATKVVDSGFSGRGIKIAVLDTGLDLAHPDFAGRAIISQSFVENEEVQDKHGHGTHCIGTACGSVHPALEHRYGIAYEAEIYVAKVLNNQGRGLDGSILEGLEWAITNGCQIVSMSIGTPTYLGLPYSRVFEIAAKRALNSGTLTIAAAGNDSDRGDEIYNAIAHPANCPSIMGVAAIDAQLQIASFSNRSCQPQNQYIDIAAPGVDIHSAWPMEMRYKRMSGTSMATPHVAGIAALYAEATGATGRELWNLLVQNACKLPLDTVDVGCGLVQVILDT